MGDGEGSLPRYQGTLLGLDTATVLGSVAVGSGQRVMAELATGVRARHAESVLPAVDWVLRTLGMDASQLGGVVVGAGPGSFTGVRIAGATAKGLVRALSVPLYSYSSLEAVAAGVAVTDRPVCAMLDARRGAVYSAVYRFRDDGTREMLLEPGRRDAAEMVEGFGEDGALFAGDGALRHRQMIRQAGARVAPAHLAAPRAAALLWLAQLDPDRGLVAVPGEWEPEYLQGSSAQRGVAG